MSSLFSIFLDFLKGKRGSDSRKELQNRTCFVQYIKGMMLMMRTYGVR